MSIFLSNKELNHIAFDQVAEEFVINGIKKELEEILKEVRVSDIKAVDLNEINIACS